MSYEMLADQIATDLHLDPRGRHVLMTEARRLAGMDDGQVRTEAPKLIEAHRASPTLAGALGVLAMGIQEERFVASLPEAQRAKYEANLVGIGTAGGAFDSKYDGGAEGLT